MEKRVILAILTLVLVFQVAVLQPLGIDAKQFDYIADLTKQIDAAPSKDEKARLLVYRARNHLNAEDLTSAENDYLASLKLKSKGPVWGELAQLYTNVKEYEKAKKVIDKIDRDFPYLSEPLNPLREVVDEQVRLAYLEAHPPVIIIDTVPNYDRKSRFDVMREVAALESSSPKNYGEDYHALCRKRWGSNYEMLQYCLKQQMKAEHSVARSPRDEIYNRCREKWGNNYEMVEYCIGNQTTARDNLRRNHRASGSKIEECKRQWGDNYEMVEYCIKN